MQSSDFLAAARRSIRKYPEVFEALLEFERTKKLPKMNRKERANFTIDRKILQEFRSNCSKTGRNMSKVVEQKLLEEISKTKRL